MGQSDALYHRLFSHPLMVEQLVGAFLPEVRAAGADPAGLERVNAKFHGHGGKRRESDVVWRLPLAGGGDLYLYLMLEFQSAGDWWMAVRAQVYEGLLWQHIIAERTLRNGDRLPPVLMVVLHNGEGRWTAPTDTAGLLAVPADSSLWPWQPRARYHLLDIGTFPNHLLSTDNLAALLFRLEHRRHDAAELTVLIDAVIRWFRGHPDYGTLRLLFTELVRQAIGTIDRTVPLPDDLQEMQTMVATYAERWIEKWTTEGHAKGQAIGEVSGKASVLRRMLTRRFGPLPADAEARIQAADSPTLDAWCDRILDARTIDEVFGSGPG